MNRDEIIARIATGSEYLQQPGLTEDQIEKARSKVAAYREQLRDMDRKAEQTEGNKQKAETNIALIREMLAGANPQRKIRR